MEYPKIQSTQEKLKNRSAIRFIDCLPSLITIGREVYLEKDHLLTQLDFLYDKNFKIVFTTSGDIRSYIIVNIQLDFHNLKKNQKEYIRTLFIESLNIFMNQYIDSLENQSENLIYLNPPKLFEGLTKEHTLSQIDDNREQHIDFAYQYYLHMKNLSLPIQIYCFFQPVTISEV